jgi:penicillin amidase
MKFVKAFLSLFFSVALIFVLSKGWAIGSLVLPPIGKLLNPFTGFWANTKTEDFSAETTLHLSGLRGSVTVLYDDNLVPHIFAENNHDLYMAQGYVTAQHRLWQMELYARAAGGRLSEVIGERTLEADKYTRRTGLGWGAEKTLEITMKNPVMKEIIEAYTDGINAYISTLSPKDYPLEYKILDYAPEKWEPIKTSLILSSMSVTLAGGSDDFRMSNILQKYGKGVIAELFPNYPPYEDPIIPTGTKWDFKPLPLPLPPTDTTKPIAAISQQLREPASEQGIGSNNWAISGSKSATGYPILAGDPHLDLTLPSIWFQIQLTSPDVNTCGVSIPGAPFVIIGFNEHIAWSETNVDADVMDWYDITFKDATRAEYKYGSEWRKTEKKIQEIKVKGKATVYDTVLYTHYGPIAYETSQTPFNVQIPKGRAMRWMAHEANEAVATFYYLNRAKNYDEYVKALSYYAVPAQNFVFASDQNDIAIWANGKYPLKWKQQGKFVMDGSNPANDWQGWIPHAHNPHVKNPERGFVSSANQFSADTTYPYYINWRYAFYARGHRINERLSVMKNATPDSMRFLQNDNLSIHARNILPTLIDNLDKSKFTAQQKKVYDLLNNWNMYHNPEEKGASVFVLWWSLLEKAIWEDEFSSSSAPMRYPAWTVSTRLLLKEPDSRWYDNVNTPEKETLQDLLSGTFRKTTDSLYKTYGEPGEKWEWAKYKATEVPHLGRVPGLGRTGVMNGGGSGIVNATTKRNGPSWRMIVALNPDPAKFKAFGLYPGGQSGNQASKFYDNMIDKWAKGEQNELVFLRSIHEKNSHIVAKVQMMK